MPVSCLLTSNGCYGTLHKQKYTERGHKGKEVLDRPWPPCTGHRLGFSSLRSGQNGAWPEELLLGHHILQLVCALGAVGLSWMRTAHLCACSVIAATPFPSQRAVQHKLFAFPTLVDIFLPFFILPLRWWSVEGDMLISSQDSMWEIALSHPLAGFGLCFACLFVCTVQLLFHFLCGFQSSSSV